MISEFTDQNLVLGQRSCLPSALSAAGFADKNIQPEITNRQLFCEFVTGIGRQDFLNPGDDLDVCLAPLHAAEQNHRKAIAKSR